MSIATITRHEHFGPEVLETIPLDAPLYAPADGRTVSRLLKGAGLPRAERGRRGSHVGFGFYVDHHSLYVNDPEYSFGRTESVRAVTLMDQAAGILRDAGFAVTGNGVWGRYVYRPVELEAVYGGDYHLVCVAHGDALTPAHKAPVFQAERQRRMAERKAQHDREVAESAERAEMAETLGADVVAWVKTRMSYGYKGRELTKVDFYALCKTAARLLNEEVS